MTSLSMVLIFGLQKLPRTFVFLWILRIAPYVARIIKAIERVKSIRTLAKSFVA